MNDPSIRPLRPEDRDAVVRLLADSEPWRTLGYTPEEWYRMFCPIPRGRDSYAAEIGGRIAGIAVVRQHFLAGDYLELLGVATWARRQGIGRRLLEYIERLVFGRTANLFACVSDFNEQARVFYKAQGYEEVGPLRDLLIPGSSEILVRKTSGPARRNRSPSGCL